MGRGKKRKRRSEVIIDDSSDSYSSDTVSSSSSENEISIPVQCWSSRSTIATENESQSSDAAIKKEIPGTSNPMTNASEGSSDLSGSAIACRKEGRGSTKTVPSGALSTLSSSTIQISEDEVSTSQGNASDALGSIASDCEQNHSLKNTVGVTISSPVVLPPENSSSMFLVPGSKFQGTKGGVVPFYFLNVHKGVPASYVSCLPSQSVAQVEMAGKSTPDKNLEESVNDKNAKESSKSLDALESARSPQPSSNDSASEDRLVTMQQSVKLSTNEIKVAASQNTIPLNQGSIVETTSPFGVQSKVKFKFLKSFKPTSTIKNSTSSLGEIPKNVPSNAENTSVIPRSNLPEPNTDSDLSGRPFVIGSSDSVSQLYEEGLQSNDVCRNGLSDSPSIADRSKSRDISSLPTATPSIISNSEIRSHCNSLQSSSSIGDGSPKHSITLNMLSFVKTHSGPLVHTSLLIPSSPCISDISDEYSMNLSDQNMFQNVSSNIPVPQVPIPIADVGNVSGKYCSLISSSQKNSAGHACIPAGESHQVKQFEDVSNTSTLTGDLELSTGILTSIEGNGNASYTEKLSTPVNDRMLEFNNSTNSCTSDIPPLIPASNSILEQSCDAEAHEFYEKLTKGLHFSPKKNCGTVLDPLYIDDVVCEEDFNGGDLFSGVKSAERPGLNHNHGSLVQQVSQGPFKSEVSPCQVNPPDATKDVEWSHPNTNVNCSFNDPDYSVIKCCLCSNGSNPFLITLTSAIDHHKFVHAEKEECFGCIKCEFTSSQLQDLHQHINRGCFSTKNTNSSNLTSDGNSSHQSSEADSGAPTIKVEPNDEYERALSNLKNALRKVNMPRFRKLLTSYQTQPSDPSSSGSAAATGDGHEKEVSRDQEDVALPKKKKSKLSDELSKMFIREGKSYLCQHCKRKFTSIYQVKLHISRHPGCLVKHCGPSGIRSGAPSESASMEPVNNIESNAPAALETGSSEMIFDIPRIKIEKLDSPPTDLLDLCGLNGMDSIPDSDPVPPTSTNSRKRKRSHDKRSTHSVNLFQANCDVGDDKNVDGSQIMGTPGTSSNEPVVESITDGSSIRMENSNEIDVSGLRNNQISPNSNCSYTPLKSSDASEPSYVNHARQYRSRPIVKPLFKSLVIKSEDQMQSSSSATPSTSTKGLNSEAILKLKQEKASPSKPEKNVPASPIDTSNKTVAYRITITKPSSLLPRLEMNRLSKESSTPSPKAPLQVRDNSNTLRVIRPKLGFNKDINVSTSIVSSPNNMLVTAMKNPSTGVDKSPQKQEKTLKVPFVKLQRLNMSNEENPTGDAQNQSNASHSNEKVSDSPSKIVGGGSFSGRTPKKDCKDVPKKLIKPKKEKSSVLQQTEESIFGS